MNSYLESTGCWAADERFEVQLTHPCYQAFLILKALTVIHILCRSTSLWTRSHCKQTRFYANAHVEITCHIWRHTLKTVSRPLISKRQKSTKRIKSMISMSWQIFCEQAKRTIQTYHPTTPINLQSLCENPLEKKESERERPPHCYSLEVSAWLKIFERVYETNIFLSSIIVSLLDYPSWSRLKLHLTNKDYKECRPSMCTVYLLERNWILN